MTTPIEHALGYLTDAHDDLHTDYQNHPETFPDGTLAGYGAALYDLTHIYLDMTATCECEEEGMPYSEEHADGTWRCAGCGTVLATEADLAEVGRDD